MGKDSKCKPSPMPFVEAPTKEGELELWRELRETNDRLQEQVEALWKKTMLQEKTWQGQIERLGEGMAALVAWVDGLEGRLTGGEAIATPVTHAGEEKRAEKSTLSFLEGHLEEMAKKVEATKLRLEKVSSMVVGSEAPSTSSLEEACTRGARGGRSNHQPKTPIECSGCGKLGHKRFRCRNLAKREANGESPKTTVAGKGKKEGQKSTLLMGECGEERPVPICWHCGQLGHIMAKCINDGAST